MKLIARSSNNGRTFFQVLFETEPTYKDIVEAQIILGFPIEQFDLPQAHTLIRAPKGFMATFSCSESPA